MTIADRVMLAIVVIAIGLAATGFWAWWDSGCVGALILALPLLLLVAAVVAAIVADLWSHREFL